MNPVKAEEKCTPAPVCQQTHCSQCLGFSQGGAIEFRPEGQSLPCMNVSSVQAPQPPPCSFHYCGETLDCAPRYYMLPLSGALQFLHEGAQNLPSVSMNTTQTPQPPQRSIHCNMEKPHVQKKNGPSGDLTTCQLRNPSSSLPQGVSRDSAHSSKKPTGDALQKRELRLMKNREAARECRRKKKEYVKCLENRVALLENQNKTLIEELRALKDIYRHKVE